MIRRETLRDRALEIAVIAIVVYLIAFYVFDLPGWLKSTAGIVLGVGWLCFYVVVPGDSRHDRETRQGTFVSTRAEGSTHASLRGNTR